MALWRNFIKFSKNFVTSHALVEVVKNIKIVAGLVVLKRVCLQSNIAPFLVRRYLRFNKSQPFISIAAILAFLGVCVGVMVLIVAMALMNGFDKEFQRKLFIMNYPITMIGFDINKHTLEDLQQNFPHLKASPFIQTQAISKSQNTLEGGIIFGIDYDLG